MNAWCIDILLRNLELLLLSKNFGIACRYWGFTFVSRAIYVLLTGLRVEPAMLFLDFFLEAILALLFRLNLQVLDRQVYDLIS